MSDDPSVRRRNLRDDLLSAAQRLRAEGRTVGEIADRLRIAKSTAYRWVGHLPLDGSSEAAVQRRLAAEARRAPHRADRRARREEAEREAGNRGGPLSCAWTRGRSSGRL
ncbi:helix-turn-helix domain-containing protein [Micromonospora sp. NPDC005707]|uniref:helix-turn-helix domain-containing protein n=1 Tax=Micromonospora sp. NPDC005707 TaxID=3157050 RepID=UPI003410C325